jgi:glutamine synthetase type III
MRIINAKKSKYYNAALENFEQARRCYERAGLAADWQCVVNEVRAEHRRKTGFMSRFNEVVAGLDSSKKRSFLERAKVSWGMPQAEGKQ